MKIRSSIRYKLSVFLLISIIVPIAASIFLSFFYTKRSLKEDAIRENSNIVHQGATSLISQLNQMNNLSLSVYTNVHESSSLYNILNRGRSDFMVERNLYSGLHAIEQSAKEVQQVYLYSDLADQSYLLINGFLKRDVGQTGLEGHYVQPLNKDDPYFEPPHVSHNYGMEEFPYSPVNTVLTIHRPVYRAPLKERIGVLSIDFKLDRLRNLSDMLYDKGNEHLYLLDDTGTTVYSSETEWIGQKPPHSWLQHARYNLFQSGYFDWKDDGFHGIVIYEKFELIGRVWTIAKQIPNDYLYSNASRVLRINMILLVSFLVVAIAATLFVSVKLTAPIKRLTESIKKIKLGKLKLDIHSDRSDEVGVLGHTIKNMVDTIDNLIMRELRLELANKNNQLKALQAQINPHFIYNTLQSIGSVALHHQVPKIYELTSSLGAMMRYNMNTEESVVPLYKEISHVEAYLELQKQRFKERLSFRIITDGADLAFRMPKMILQPLVENCFKHGFENNSGPLEITLVCRSDDEALRIVIEDNGLGVPPERMRQLVETIGQGETDSDSDGSIGLINVISRLRLYNGEESQLLVRNLEPAGFSVTLIIPVRKEGSST